ncbi:MAG: glycerophosphodiester phosphodiesterase family protein [Oscillospiraceae bacterium]
MFDYDGIEEKVWKLIDRFGLKDRVILSSFHVQTLLRLKALAPEAPCGLLNQDRIIHPGWATQALGLRAYHPLYLRLRPSVIRELKEHDVEVNAYTVNGPGPLAYLFLADIHSVITNQPRRALALRRLIQGNPGLTNQKNVVK